MLQNLDIEWPNKQKIREDNLKMFLEEDNSFSDFIPKAIVDIYNTGKNLKFMENLVLKKIEDGLKKKKEQKGGYENYILSKMVIFYWTYMKKIKIMKNISKYVKKKSIVILNM